MVKSEVLEADEVAIVLCAWSPSFVIHKFMVYNNFNLFVLLCIVHFFVLCNIVL